MIHCENTGLVYTNPVPHLKAIHAWHPSIVHLGGEDFLCAFDLGEAAESLDYRTYFSRSNDGGIRWSPPERLFHDSRAPSSTHTVRLARIGDETLVGLGARFYRNDPKQGLTNRATLGFVPMDVILLRSDDGGRIWQGPATIIPPLEGPAFEICHAIVKLADGRWLAPTQTWPGWDGWSAHGWKAVAFESTDRGQTWPTYLTVFESHDEQLIHFEQSLVQLGDGRLLAVAWAYDSHTRQTLPTPYAVSNDGKSFSPSRPTGLRGQTAKLLALRDGRILCVYRRDNQPGLWAQLVRLDGDQWINLEELDLWTGDSSNASTASLSTSDHLSSLKFGFPSMVELPDGRVKIVFWCVENGTHNVRWFDLSIRRASGGPHFDGQRVEAHAATRAI